MEITVRTKELNEKANGVVAISDLTFGDLIRVRGVQIREGKNGRFVCMPSYATNKVDEEGRTVFKDVCNPITKEAREEIIAAAIESLDTGKEVVIADKGCKEGEKDISARAVPYEGRGGVIGMGALYLNDSFVINCITVREGKNKEAYVSYPSYKTSRVNENGKNEYKNFCYPISKESRRTVDQMILEKFNQNRELANTPQEKDDMMEKQSSREVKETSEDPLAEEGIKKKLTQGKAKQAAEKGASKQSKKTKEQAIE